MALASCQISDSAIRHRVVPFADLTPLSATGGARLITKETRDEMRRMLTDIQDGTYARRWIAEDKNGRPWFNETRRKEQQHPIEEVGAKLRALMPFLKPVTKREPAGVL